MKTLLWLLPWLCLSSLSLFGSDAGVLLPSPTENSDQISHMESIPQTHQDFVKALENLRLARVSDDGRYYQVQYVTHELSQISEKFYKSNPFFNDQKTLKKGEEEAALRTVNGFIDRFNEKTKADKNNLRIFMKNRHDEAAKRAETEYERRNFEARINAVATATALSFGFMFIIYHMSENFFPAFFQGKPSIVLETSLKTTWEKLFSAKKNKKNIDFSEMIYHPKLKAVLDRTVTIIKNSIENKKDLHNMIFYGPPGTGKTMFAKALAKSTGADYVIASGASLMQNSTKDSIREIIKLFKFSETSKKPVIVFIDEAECAFLNRQRANEGARMVTNAFLSLVEKPSHRKIMFVFSTNAPKDLDPAILSRVGKHSRIYFSLPEEQERMKLMKFYYEKCLKKEGYSLHPELKNIFHKLAAYLKGWSGRDLEQMMKDLANYMDSIAQTTIKKEHMIDFLNEAVQNTKNLLDFSQDFSIETDLNPTNEESF